MFHIALFIAFFVIFLCFLYDFLCNFLCVFVDIFISDSPELLESLESSELSLSSPLSLKPRNFDTESSESPPELLESTELSLLFCEILSVLLLLSLLPNGK